MLSSRSCKYLPLRPRRSVRRCRHYYGYYLLLFPPSSCGGGWGERAGHSPSGKGAQRMVPAWQRRGKTRCPSPSPQPLAAPVAQAGHSPIARRRRSSLPVRVGFGGPTAIPPCQEGHNTMLPEEPPPESLPPSATGSQTPNTRQVLPWLPGVFQQPLASPAGPW